MLSDPGGLTFGRVCVTADRLLSPAKVRCPLNSINAARRGDRKRIGVAEKILLKILLKQNLRLTLSTPETNISVRTGSTGDG
jgi:hypothetical protein